jgi:DNA-binding MarR family transcriptional regulator
MLEHEMIKLENQLCFAIYACSRKMTRLYQPLLNQLNITYPQYIVLLVLWEKKQQTVTELGEQLLLDSGTLTPLLKRMEKNGIVQRNRSDADERKVYINLTEQGKTLKERASKIPEKMFCLSGLSSEEFLHLKTDLELLLDRFQEF